MIAVASTRGTTRYRIGLMAWARKAVISSPTTIVPISAAMLAPAKPVSVIAPISGPSSRNVAMAMRSARRFFAPYCSRIGLICRARITPMQNVTRLTTGTARTPTRSS